MCLKNGSGILIALKLIFYNKRFLINWCIIIEMLYKRLHRFFLEFI